MTTTDLIQTKSFIKELRLNGIPSESENGFYADEVCLLSPTTELFDYNDLFWQRFRRNIKVKNINNWNLDNPANERHGLIIAHNIFHYSKDPKLWFKNVTDACDCFVVQDLIKRQRGSDYELCDDGDSTRYCFGFKPTPASHWFDLLTLKDIGIEIPFVKIYEGEPNSVDSRPIHFVALLRKIKKG